MKEQLRLGLTCPIVQEPDAPIIVRSDGERLVWVTHHLVDLCWAWRVSGKRGRGLRGGNRTGQRQKGQATSAIGDMLPSPLYQASWLPLSLVSFLLVAYG